MLTVRLSHFLTHEATRKSQHGLHLVNARTECQHIGGPRFVEIAGGFVRRSQAEAHFLDYCGKNGLTVICREIDSENDAIDYMTTRGAELIQFAVESWEG